VVHALGTTTCSCRETSRHATHRPARVQETKIKDAGYYRRPSVISRTRSSSASRTRSDPASLRPGTVNANPDRPPAHAPAASEEFDTCSPAPRRQFPPTPGARAPRRHLQRLLLRFLSRTCWCIAAAPALPRLVSRALPPQLLPRSGLCGGLGPRFRFCLSACGDFGRCDRLSILPGSFLACLAMVGKVGIATVKSRSIASARRGPWAAAPAGPLAPARRSVGACVNSRMKSSLRAPSGLPAAWPPATLPTWSALRPPWLAVDLLRGAQIARQDAGLSSRLPSGPCGSW